MSFLLLSSLGFAAMAFLTKLACETYDGSTVAGLRFTFGAVVTGLLWATGKVDARPRALRLVLVRGATGGVAVVLYFLSVEHLSVGLATLLNYTSPPMTAVLAWIYLRERLPAAVFWALGLTFGGVLLVVAGQGEQGVGGFVKTADPFWMAMGILSAVCSAAAITSIRALRSSTPPESVWSIFFWFCVIGAVCAVPASKGLHAPNTREALLLVGVGATAMLAQLGMNRVMRWVPAALFGVTAQMSVVLTMLAGVMFLDEPWSLMSLAGALVTIGGVLWAVRAEGRASRAEAQGTTRRQQ
ncbi:MAG: DMT family transporter [Myxococcales bacterium]|nr:DMT family transporter [Myxococcales bacterium]